jgi:surfeit locus 1 family protein
VLSALRLEGSSAAVLVQRGWVPRDFQDRSRLPEVPTPEGMVQVQGRLAPPPSQLFELGAGAAGPIRQNVDLSQLAAEWRVPLLERVSVLQTNEDASGLVRDWPRFVGDQHKHLAYAAQWFAMSAIAAGLYLWFQILLPRLKCRSHGQNPR